MLSAGKANKYFDLWEEDWDTADPTKSYEDLLHKVGEYARRRKLDSSAKNKMRNGDDPMDVEALGGLELVRRWVWRQF